jgi:capsular exopolysaccharide synthesis family protein
MMSAISGNPQIQALRNVYTQKELEYSNLFLTYKADHPKMVKLKEEMHILKKQLEVEARIVLAFIKKDHDVALNRENFYKSALDEYKRETLLSTDRMVHYQILKRDADTNRELYNGILQRLKETGISANMTTSTIQIMEKGEVPRKPFKPDKQKNLLFALLIGLAGGIGLAFFADYLDNTLKSPEDVEKELFLPSLGIVPKVALKDVVESRGKALMVSLDDKSSSLLEAYRSITTYIQFSSPVRPPKVIALSSARRDEGKSTTCINLAITQSSSYGRTVIIDADMRKPQLHKIFSLDNSSGLSSYLTGQVDFGADGLVQPTSIPNLDVITAGVIPPNPSELLSSYRMKELIDHLSPLYSFILIDTPPILGLSDSLILSTIADGLILVVKAGSTPKDSVNQAKRLLRGVNASILGVVLNYIKESDLRYGSYGYYSYYYYEEEDGKARKKKRKKHRREQNDREVA